MATTDDPVDRERAIELLARIAALRSGVQETNHLLRLLESELPVEEVDEDEDPSLLPALRGELAEARGHLGCALRYLTADPKNGGCRLFELEIIAGSWRAAAARPPE